MRKLVSLLVVVSLQFGAIAALADRPKDEVCYAETACASTGPDRTQIAYTVSCKVLSTPKRSCSANKVVGQSVTCSGADVFGNWDTFSVYCGNFQK